MKKQNIEDIFSSMEDFSSVPPPELWANIEEKLDKPKKKKRAILWWSAAACLLLGLLLPSVLYFSSNNGIKTINNGTGGNNSVVIEENKKDIHDTKTISTEENSTEKNSGTVKNSPEESSKNNAANAEENQTKETAVAHADSKNKIDSDASNSKSNSEKRIVNQAVAEGNIVLEKENQHNSFSKNKNSEKGNANQAVAEKSFNIGNKNQFNSFSKNEKGNSEKGNANQAVAEKTFNTGNQNQFNSFSKNEKVNSEKRNANQVVAGKTFTTGNQNQFNSFSKNQTLNTGKRNGSQAVAEKTFTTGNQNQFNSFSKNQEPNSIFENQLNSNSNSIALNPSSSVLNNKQTGATTIKTEKSNTDNTPKSNSKFSNVLSKQDSVQLAELQNLEKGITPEVKKEKEKDPKTTSKAEKWALEVFAGIANSENTKNDKTLGNVNDSKQTSTYGVKTKYKINKKWAVGSGFKINELGQSVANVSYIKTANNAFLGTSDYLVQNSTVPQIASPNGYVLMSNTTKNALKSDNIQSGNLDQSLRYVEMPLEVSYAVFSKNKASINLNTGGFVGKLISNNVAIDGNSLGKNENANDFVYGSTLSSTVQYRVYKKTNVFVEPAMNYYINPLNSQSFNQFQWGLNFGLNVSF